MKLEILNSLTKIATGLDQKGLHKEADQVDKIAIAISKLSDEEIERTMASGGYEDSELKELMPSSEEFYGSSYHEEENNKEEVDQLELHNKLNEILQRAKQDPSVQEELNQFLDKFFFPEQQELGEKDDISKTAAKKKKSKPKNKKLWQKAIAAAKKKFDVYPSLYANSWAKKWYDEKGGKWE
jgi:hypothetical protein